ncbi:energy transducer TonB [Asticcacaulis benevestitus]|uniref:Uncharacterized protein n=1 Tax=Asticcacaulis benevestitus DSM 16100 = ATCC BAA-896 TaxID=1121022 RepID=V4RTM0_9CAUL|nr:energy transducer TonB [Asticcacaulis benevestitus]ESQ94513.1 hypothetical protein ABENE_00025 [Asticcacaulis benevestitus DSM 16100 = ATCC BAA-896]
MFIALALVATLMGSAEESAPLPPEIPADAVFYYPEEARKMRMRISYYPPKASMAHADGSAVIDCQVQAGGTLSRCAVLEETPPDMEFGKATAMLFLKRAKVTPEEMRAQPAGGWWKKFKYIWVYKPLDER